MSNMMLRDCSKMCLHLSWTRFAEQDKYTLFGSIQKNGIFLVVILRSFSLKSCLSIQKRQDSKLDGIDYILNTNNIKNFKICLKNMFMIKILLNMATPWPKTKHKTKESGLVTILKYNMSNMTLRDCSKMCSHLSRTRFAEHDKYTPFGLVQENGIFLVVILGFRSLKSCLSIQKRQDSKLAGTDYIMTLMQIRWISTNIFIDNTAGQICR